jgi:hypothetical protein
MLSGVKSVVWIMAGSDMSDAEFDYDGQSNT